MRVFRPKVLFALLAVVTLLATACASEEPADDGGDTGTESGAAGGDDLLARIQDDGVIRVSTDPAYEPQSFLNPETNEYEGFDIDVATEIANRLGVSVQWETPSWNALTAGGWSDRWDMSVGSMTVLPTRAEVLDFTQPYYWTPASAAVHADNTTINDYETDLDGKRIGVCGACSYEFFLMRQLDIAGNVFEYPIDDPQIQTYDTDSTAIQDLGLGDGVRLDAVISATPTLQGSIDKGKPIRLVSEEPLFYEPLAPAFDKSSALDNTSLVEAVDQIIGEMHSDGTLSQLSMQWYGEDLTQNPSAG